LAEVLPGNGAKPLPDRQLYRIDLVPLDWNHGHEMSIGIMGTGADVTSSHMREKPQDAVHPLLSAGDAVFTGTVIDIAEFVDLGLVAQVVLLTARDTKNDRRRWRIRSQPPDRHHPYSFLWTGRRSGEMVLPGETKRSDCP
jgi:hypothetical protein